SWPQTACAETFVAAGREFYADRTTTLCSAPVRTIPRRTAVLAVRVVDRRNGIYAAAAGLRR
ncbi:MAG: hypothetical protein ACREXY_17180, partial [Gammaproteobacteria bacterium]